MEAIFFYQGPIGTYALVEKGGALTHLLFENAKMPEEITMKETAVMKAAKAQLDEYFAGVRKTFDLPFRFEKENFSRKVWEALLSIPYGETATYKDIAIRCGSPRGFRAVGNANNKNPLPIFYPCHRVVGSNGKLVGFGGGLPVKEYLLQLEKANK